MNEPENEADWLINTGKGVLIGFGLAFILWMLSALARCDGPKDQTTAIYARDGF